MNEIHKRQVLLIRQLPAWPQTIAGADRPAVFSSMFYGEWGCQKVLESGYENWLESEMFRETFIDGIVLSRSVMMDVWKYTFRLFTICQRDIKHIAIQSEHGGGLFQKRSLHWYVNRMWPYCLWGPDAMAKVARSIISTKNIYWESICPGPIYGCVPIRGSSRNPFSLLTQLVAAEEGSAEQSQQCKSINWLGIGEFLYLI